VQIGDNLFFRDCDLFGGRPSELFLRAKVVSKVVDCMSKQTPKVCNG
jgi:hypothetical protein